MKTTDVVNNLLTQIASVETQISSTVAQLQTRLATSHALLESVNAVLKSTPLTDGVPAADPSTERTLPKVVYAIPAPPVKLKKHSKTKAECYSCVFSEDRGGAHRSLFCKKKSKYTTVHGICHKWLLAPKPILKKGQA